MTGPADAGAPAPAAGRLHYLDNLRALAMLAGVLFHAALAYSPLAHPLFPTADRQSAAIIDVFAWCLHLFRMPLFFVVAGFFAAVLVRRRGMVGMFRNRLWRVALPFVLFWPLVDRAMTAATLHAARTALHPSPLLSLIRGWLAAGPLPPQLPGTDHLWFLYYLMFFYVLTWAARSLDLGWLGARVQALSPGRLLGAMPLLLAPALAAVPAPFPAPESFFPQFWALAYFGAFFAFGYGLQQAPEQIARFRPALPWLLVGSALLYTGFLWLMPRSATPAPAIAWLLALLAAYIGVWATIACLCLGRIALDTRHGLLRYLADASYWIYLVHLPVLLVIQYRLLDLDWPWPAKFALALGLTLGLCLLSYEALVRRTVLAGMLGGGGHPARRSPDATSVSAAS